MKILENKNCSVKVGVSIKKKGSVEAKTFKKLFILKQPDSQMYSIPMNKLSFDLFGCEEKQPLELPCWLFPLGILLTWFPWDLLAISTDTWSVDLFWKEQI